MFCPVVSEEKNFKKLTNDDDKDGARRRTPSDDKSSLGPIEPGELKMY